MRFPHLFYNIKAKCGRRCAVFAIFARQFFLQTASIRREAVTALQVVDALHIVGSQLEVEDVVILGDMGSLKTVYVGERWHGGQHLFCNALRGNLG